MIVVAHAGFALVSLLIASGVAGWAIGYVLAKLIAELMVAAIPLVMAKVARDGP
jgi:tetrahydromethanopterin S-methyltransferase subunit F